MMTAGLCAAAFMLPFSVEGCHLGLLLFVCGWIAEGEWKEKWMAFRSQPVIWAFLFLFLLHLAGVTVSSLPAESWFNVEKKIPLALLPLTLGTVLTLRPAAVRLVARSFVGGCLLATVICLVVACQQYFADAGQFNFDTITFGLFAQENPSFSPLWLYFSYIQLANGIGMHPTFLALYVMMAGAWVIYEAMPVFPNLSGLQQTLLLLLIVHFSVFVFLLSSRMVTLIMLGSAIVLMGRFSDWRQLATWTTSLVLLSFALLLVLNPVTRYRNWQEVTNRISYQPVDGLYSYSTGIRWSLWKTAGQTILDANLLTGAGTGDVKNSVERSAHLFHSDNIMHTYDPHNQFLYTQIALGLPGLFAWVACLAIPAWMAYRRKHFLFLGFLVSFAAVCLTESAMESQKGIVYFTLFCSLFLLQIREPLLLNPTTQPCAPTPPIR